MNNQKPNTMITNTAKKENRPEWLMGGNPEAIENQEKRGQQELVNAKDVSLPVDITKEDREKLEAAGVVFGEPHLGDPIFMDALLPDGWKIKETDHSMWTKLVDGDGKEIASIFYKAAFYDRSAFIQVS